MRSGLGAGAALAAVSPWRAGHEGERARRGL